MIGVQSSRCVRIATMFSGSGCGGAASMCFAGLLEHISALPVISTDLPLFPPCRTTTLRVFSRITRETSGSQPTTDSSCSTHNAGMPWWTGTLTQTHRVSSAMPLRESSKIDPEGSGSRRPRGSQNSWEGDPIVSRTIFTIPRTPIRSAATKWGISGKTAAVISGFQPPDGG